MGNYTVQLLDATHGRIVLDQVSSDSAADAATAAVAAPPVSGAFAATAGNVVDQAAVLKVTGTTVDGFAVPAATSLPVVPAADAPSKQY